MHQTMLEQLEASRERMHRYIDDQFDELRTRILCGEYVASIAAMLEREYPLDTADATFKGKKPVTIHFADGRELPVSSWKEVAAILLQDCISNPYCSSRMYDMAGSYFGRNESSWTTHQEKWMFPFTSHRTYTLRENLIPNR